MIESLSNKIIHQVYSIYEGMVDNMINSVENDQLRKMYNDIFEESKKVFKNKIPYVNWFFQQTFKLNNINVMKDILKELNHFYSYGIPKIDNFPIVNYTLDEVIDKFEEN